VIGNVDLRLCFNHSTYKQHYSEGLQVSMFNMSAIVRAMACMKQRCCMHARQPSGMQSGT
jgi:hypothetical protein